MNFDDHEHWWIAEEFMTIGLPPRFKKIDLEGGRCKYYDTVGGASLLVVSGEVFLSLFSRSNVASLFARAYALQGLRMRKIPRSTFIRNWLRL